jgi:glc operon protein GlcG
MKKVFALVAGCLLAASVSAQAQLIDRKALSLAEARKAVAAAIEEMKKNKWNMVIAVVDEAGQLITLDRTDNAQRASIDIAIGKARTAAMFRRPSAVFEDAVNNKGRTASLSYPGYVLVQGGLPIIVNGVVIGAVGASGELAAQDEQVAKAGIDAIGK